MKTNQVKLHLSPELHKALRYRSVDVDQTMSAIAEQILRQGLGLPSLLTPAVTNAHRSSGRVIAKTA